MIRLLTLILALSAIPSFGATVYRDRDVFVPGGICMVEFYGNTLNAALIAEVYAGPMVSTERKRTDAFFPTWENIETNFMAVRVQLVNRSSYTKNTETKAEAETRKIAFLQLIKDTCK